MFAWDGQRKKEEGKVRVIRGNSHVPAAGVCRDNGEVCPSQNKVYIQIRIIGYRGILDL